MKVTVSLAAFLMGLLIAGTGFAVTHEEKAKDTGKTGTTGSMEAQSAEHQLLSINQLVGKQIANNEDQMLGEIHSVLIDPETGQIAYVMVSTGGMLSTDMKLVPYKALDVSEEEIILDMDQQRLANAPGMSEGQAVEEFDREASEFFGVSPYFEEEEEK